MNQPLAAPAFLAAWDTCASRAHGLLSPAAAEAARLSWFDTLAAMAAGTVENCTRAAMQAAPGDVALVLGTASHALDYDDVCMLATCHPSAPPVSALLALLPQLERQQPGLPLRDLLAAYLVGTETMLRLGEWLGFRHYALGFHATGTLGAVGSAAAAAHALRLPAAQAHAALSIAASSACGLRANFGTDTKPLHVGFAASAGVRAALLASAGANASDDIWGASGLPLAFNGGEPLAALPWAPDNEWAIVQPGFEHKRYPSCYLTHRLIAGILRIRAGQPATAYQQPVHIDIEVASNGLAALKHPRASTALEGKFSGHYCAAAAWQDGQVTLRSFTDTAVQRVPLQAQMQRVRLRERSAGGESLATAPVHVTVSGEGWSDRVTVDWAPGSPADPMTRDQLEQKWQDCASHAAFPPELAFAGALLDAPLEDAAAEALLTLREGLLAATRRSAAHVTDAW